jgi:hypothetical protein
MIFSKEAILLRVTLVTKKKSLEKFDLKEDKFHLRKFLFQEHE